MVGHYYEVDKERNHMRTSWNTSCMPMTDIIKMHSLFDVLSLERSSFSSYTNFTFLAPYK